MGLRVANRPIINEDGYTTATIVGCKFGKGVETIKKSRDDIDTREYERFELTVEMDGTSGPISTTIFTGTSLNGVIDEVGRGKAKKSVYNRLTSIALGLNLVSVNELSGKISQEICERVEESFLSIQGLRVQFKLGKIEGRSLAVPIPDTIKLIA